MKAPTPRAGVGATPSPLSPKTQARIKNNRERALILRKQHQDRLDAPPMPQEWLPEHLRGDFVGRGERERRERAEQHALRHRAAAEVAASVDDAGAGGGDGAEPLIVDDGDIDRRMAEEWHWACDSDASTPGNSTPTPISYGIATVRPLADLGNTCFISCLVQLFLRMPKFLRRCQDCRDRQGRVNAPLCHLLADFQSVHLRFWPSPCSREPLADPFWCPPPSAFEPVPPAAAPPCWVWPLPFRFARNFSSATSNATLASPSASLSMA